jgi:hypothetical protein
MGHLPMQAPPRRVRAGGGLETRGVTLLRRHRTVAGGPPQTSAPFSPHPRGCRTSNRPLPEFVHEGGGWNGRAGGADQEPRGRHDGGAIGVGGQGGVSLLSVVPPAVLGAKIWPAVARHPLIALTGLDHPMELQATVTDVGRRASSFYLHLARKNPRERVADFWPVCEESTWALSTGVRPATA